MHLAKEAVDQERVEVVYTHTSKMLANGLSKPFDPKEHLTFVAVIQDGDKDIRQAVGAG